MRLHLVLAASVMVLAQPASAEPGIAEVGVAAHGNTGSSSFGLGITAHLLAVATAHYRIGILVRHDWVRPASERQEYDVTQQEILIVNRFSLDASRKVDWAFDLSLGAIVYSGKVDIPITEGCFGCGKYGDRTVSAALQPGIVASLPLDRHFWLQAGTHLGITFPLGVAFDVHNFVPPPLLFHLDVGLAARF